MTSKRKIPLGSGEPPKEHQSDQPVERLVTVESQREFDVLSGQRAERTFLKMYVAARTSGLLAAISDRDWKTLCTLATYMDADGYCFPSQAELAQALGCSRQMANARVSSLARFRFQGQAVLLVEQQRDDGGKWKRNEYRVLPIARLAIFDQQSEQASVQASKQDRRHQNRPPKRETTPRLDAAAGPMETVSRKSDTVDGEATVSSATVTVKLDTNKNQEINKITLSNIRRASARRKGGEGPTSSAGTQPDPNASDAYRITPSRIDSPPADTAGRSATSPTVERGGIEPIGTTLARFRAPRLTDTPDDEDRPLIVAYLEDFAREFRDQAPLKHSVSRALNLYRQSGRSREVFIAAMYQARARTKEATKVHNRMAYWFRCLEDALGLKDDPPAGEPPPAAE